jgi:phosphoribosylformylglycinamidine cyclo-ligase
MIDSYAAAGVDTDEAGRGIAALVAALGRTSLGQPSRSRLRSGHYASVLEIAPGLGLALSTDGVGSKLLIAERAGRLDTVGIDCVAMNVNDIICVGAEPVAMLDYIAVPRAQAAALEQVGIGLARGAELAGIEIPGGELAVLPELVTGLELSGTAVGTVALDAIVSGEAIRAGDALVGMPSSGFHSNGYTLVRRILGERLAEHTEELLAPTIIYVRAVLELLRSGIEVHGLAHVTGDGLLNLRRLSDAVGFQIDAPLPVPPICELVCELGGIEHAEAYQVFNMGCGFIAVVAAADAARAAELLERHHKGSRVIGAVTDHAGAITVPSHDIRL